MSISEVSDLIRSERPVTLAVLAGVGLLQIHAMYSGHALEKSITDLNKKTESITESFENNLLATKNELNKQLRATKNEIDKKIDDQTSRMWTLNIELKHNVKQERFLNKMFSRSGYPFRQMDEWPDPIVTFHEFDAHQ